MQPINAPSVRNYNNVGTRNNGFEYRLMPLSFNLQQKGNTKSLANVKHRVEYNNGDCVTGVCLYDKKLHTGYILNVLYDEQTNKPTTVYILDSENKFVLPLSYKSLEKN